MFWEALRANVGTGPAVEPVGVRTMLELNAQAFYRATNAMQHVERIIDTMQMQGRQHAASSDFVTALTGVAKSSKAAY